MVGTKINGVPLTYQIQQRFGELFKALNSPAYYSNRQILWESMDDFGLPAVLSYDQYEMAGFLDDVGFLYDVGSLKRDLLLRNHGKSLARPKTPTNDR